MILTWLLACRAEVVWPERIDDACAASALPTGEALLRLDHDGVPRSALIWAPPAAGPRDVVFDLHDFRAEPRRQAWYSRWVPTAAVRGMVLVAPDGRSATWNAGHGCCGRSVEKHSDDRGFLDEVARRIDATTCPTGHLLATGIGNGGMMAHRWACEADVVDAVVSVGGALQLDTCDNPRPIPLVHYHGDADTQYPAQGNDEALPLAHALDLWKRRNQVVEPPVALNGGAFSCLRWDGAAPVVSCTVHGMVDIWPGSEEFPTDASFTLSDATEGALTAVVLPWWNAHPTTRSP
jgi:polyhydroxybutyrate depolymerase